jgi:SAM-dependent methyltransferase
LAGLPAAPADILGRMPMYISSENLAIAARHGCVAEIHEKDFVFDFVKHKLWAGEHDRAVANYFELGNYSSRLVRDYADEFKRVSDAVKVDWSPRKILDFASGYGCVARHLKRDFPDCHISVADIHPDAVQFGRDVLAVDAIQSSPVPELFSVPRQDIIFALSFFSHMPQLTFARWLIALSRHLNPNGMLLFTANGHVTREKLFPEWQPDGRFYAFRPSSEQQDLDPQEYGLTLSGFGFVADILRSIPNLRVSRFQEGVWWAVQDVYVCQMGAGIK